MNDYIYYVVFDERTNDERATVGTYENLFCDSWNPNTRATCIIPLIVSGKSYQERKKDLEQKAILYSYYTAPGLSYNELSILNEFFEVNGRRYGLLTEFKENAIC